MGIAVAPVGADRGRHAGAASGRCDRAMSGISPEFAGAEEPGAFLMEHGVSFEGFRFELQSGRLWAGDREVRLTPKASDVLKLLVARAGAPVSKDELFATVWSGTAVSDDALTSCIQELRRALADDPKQPRFIETRHRRGYRFIARLTEPAPVAPGPPALPRGSFRNRGPSVRGHESRSRSGLPLRRPRGGTHQRAHAYRRPARRRADGLVSVSRRRCGRPRRSAGSSASGRCSKAAFERRTTACASPSSSSKSRPAITAGRSASIAR